MIDDGTDVLCYLTNFSSNGTFLRSRPDASNDKPFTAVGRNKSVLLMDGDEVEIRQVAEFTFRQKYFHRADPSHIARSQLSEHDWEISNRVLGTGGFGKANSITPMFIRLTSEVYVTIHKKSGLQTACKILPHDQLKRVNSKYDREAKILNTLSHVIVAFCPRN